MGGIVSKIQNSIDGVAQDVGSTLTTVTNTISNLQHDASGTIANVADECVESLRIITHRANHTSFLLTNAVLALTTAIALGILLHLTNSWPFLRAVVWTMYASLCFHMLLTYLRHSRYAPLPTSQSQQVSLKMIIAQSNDQSKIDLSGYKLTDEDMEIVINEAMHKRQCTALQLINSEITPNGVSILANALSRNKTLEQLSLWNNQIGDMGVQVLCNVLSTNRNTLKKLDLSENGITDAGAEYLARMLKTNTILTRLTLSRNNISDEGVQELANAIQNRNKTLQTLSFTENKSLTDSSVDSLINMFRHHQSLEKLWVNDCNLSETGQYRLKKAASSIEDFRVYV